MRTLPCVRMLLCFFALAVHPALLLAQGNTGSLSGLIVDVQHLPVPGAHVTIRETDRDWERSIDTRADGEFEFSGLLPGHYHLRVALAGFTFPPRDVIVEVNQRLRV